MQNYGYCEYCGCTSHLSGCPNAEPMRPVFKCKQCGDGIYEGDDYFDAAGRILCTDCCQQLTAYE